MTTPARRRARRVERLSRQARWWVHLPIRSKGLLVVALPVITLAVTLLVRIPFNQQQEATSALLARATDTRYRAQELLLALLDVEGGVRGYALTRDPSFLARFDNARQTLPNHLSGLARVVGPGEEARALELVAAEMTHGLSLSAEVIALVNGGAPASNPRIQQRVREVKEAMESVRISLGGLRRTHDALVAQSQGELERIRERLQPVVMTTFVGGLLGAVLAGWLFATGIATRVRALEDNAVRLARGERLTFAQSRGRDEIGSLDRALRRASLLLRLRDRELRALNAQLEHNVHEQMLLNRELEAFSYSVSHDLRAPLRSIDGFAQALREDWGDRLDESGQDHLSRVRNAAQRMGRLIDDLLNLSRLTRAPVQRSDVDLSQLARDVCAELVERNPTRQVTWKISDGLHAQCDAALARVVLENLLGNAWKFTSKQTESVIEFCSVPHTEPPIFVVRDNGAGFDMKYADKLFAPFQRLHTEREFPGTGVGLATVQRIVRKHGGDVRVTAGLGDGAAFYFTLEPGEVSPAASAA
jgi:signal transduction histidine kinase